MYGEIWGDKFKGWLAALWIIAQKFLIHLFGGDNPNIDKTCFFLSPKLGDKKACVVNDWIITHEQMYGEILGDNLKAWFAGFWIIAQLYLIHTRQARN